MDSVGSLSNAGNLNNTFFFFNPVLLENLGMLDHCSGAHYQIFLPWESLLTENLSQHFDYCVAVALSPSLSFCRGSRVPCRGSRVIFFSGFVVLLLAVGSISAAQSSPVYMFFPDLVKCKYITDLIIYL